MREQVGKTVVDDREVFLDMCGMLWFMVEVNEWRIYDKSLILRHFYVKLNKFQIDDGFKVELLMDLFSVIFCRLLGKGAVKIYPLNTEDLSIKTDHFYAACFSKFLALTTNGCCWFFATFP